MGLYQQFWAFRKRYVTVIQRLLRGPNARCNPWGQHEVPRSFNPIYCYWCITRQLGAVTGISCLQPPRPVLSSTSLFDEEDTAEDTGDKVAVPLSGGRGIQCHGVQ